MHSRFKPGQTGNPAGRTKGGQNILTLLAKTLNTQVVINENGRRRTITKREAFIVQIVNKAASGDLRAIQQLLHLSLMMEGKEQQLASTTEFPISKEDRDIIQEIAERARKFNKKEE